MAGKIVDYLGRPIDRKALRDEHAGPTLAGVRTIWPRNEFGDITPQSVGAMLREAEVPGHGAAEQYLELAEVMEERDLHYLGVLQTRKRQVAQIGVTIEPASDSRDDVLDADLVREFFARSAIEDELIDMLDAIGKGYSVLEIDWDCSDGQFMPLRLVRRMPQWFDFDARSGTRLMQRDEGYQWRELQPFKFVTLIMSAKSGLPIRGGLARAAAWGHLFKYFTLHDWVRFVESYGQPIRLGKFGKGATKEDKAILYRAVVNVAADAAAIVPEDMDISFVDDTTVRGRSEIYRDLVKYLDSQVSIAVLGQTLTTDSGEGGGSYALGQVHNLVRQDIEKSDARQLAEALRRDLVIPIIDLNRPYRAHREYPAVRIMRATAMDLQLLAGALKELVPLGLRVKADQVRTLLHLDAPDEDDEVLEARQSAVPPMPPMPAPSRDTATLATAALGPIDTPRSQTQQARRELGPLTDEWAAALRVGLDSASTLSDYARWLDDAGESAVDITPMARALGDVLLAATLAGRYDVSGEDADSPPRSADTVGTASRPDPESAYRDALLALAVDSADSAHLPFAEQIEFFRDKVSLRTQSWTEIWQDEHSQAFVVAGAAKDDLIGDLRGAVDSAITEGTTLETFRSRFDEIVEKHGWSYKGKRDKRTRVIYDTNIRTSYAAGRWDQMQDIKARRPWWRYRHSGYVDGNPRLEHLAWDGLVLHSDDPWWQTHFPPNGWGCGCYVETLSDRDLQRLDKHGPDTAPPLEMRTETVGTGGPSPRVVQVPKGIDPGFAYAPGREAPDT